REDMDLGRMELAVLAWHRSCADEIARMDVAQLLANQRTDAVIRRQSHDVHRAVAGLHRDRSAAEPLDCAAHVRGGALWSAALHRLANSDGPECQCRQSRKDRGCDEELRAHPLTST